MASEAGRARPPARVLTAFGADGPLAALAGGRGVAWRAGGIVLKPADAGEALLAWQAGLLDGIHHDGLRLAPPRRSLEGTFVVDGWGASAFCAGRHQVGRWLDVIAAGERFHAALAGVACPELVRARDDPWSVADRAAWDDAPLAPYLRAPHVARLAGRRAPIAAPSQLVHGDLAGNVLFADPMPPAVIDLSMYCRPAAYASAIVVADALVWEGATPADLEPVASGVGFPQLLVRALLFRIVTDWLVDPRAAQARASAYASVVDLAVAAADGGGWPR